MKKLLTILLVFASLSSFAQFDIVKRKITLDSLNARLDYIWVNDTAKFVTPIYVNGNLFDGNVSTYTASGGVVLSGDDFRLGTGTLYGNTIIDGAFDLTFGNIGATALNNFGVVTSSQINLYSGDPTPGNNVTSFLSSPTEMNISVRNTSNQTAGLIFNATNLKVIDDINSTGLVYHADYSATGLSNPRWIPDIAAVRSEISDSVQASTVNYGGTVPYRQIPFMNSTGDGFEYSSSFGTDAFGGFISGNTSTFGSTVTGSGFRIYTSGTERFKANAAEANGPSAIAYKLNTSNTLTGTAQVMSVQNNSTKLFSVTKDTIFQKVNIVSDSALIFKPIAKTDHQEGRLFYCDSAKTLVFQNNIEGFNLNIGQEHTVPVFNNTGSLIPDGRLVTIDSVRINGSIVSTVKFAGIYSRDSISGVGMATVDIPDQSFGIVTLFGEVRGLNTSAFNNADPIYVDTMGYLTNVKPLPPALTLRVGYVQYADADSGQIYMLPGSVGYSKAPNYAVDTTRQSLSVTINTLNVFEYLPLSSAGVAHINYGYTVQGDSIQPPVSGDYDIDLGMSFQGNPSGDTWRYGIFKNGVELHSKSRTTASNSVGDVDVSVTVYLQDSDWISFKIANETDTDNPTIVDMSYEIKYEGE